eukprot:TRINITY_DN2684_c1_g1_i1.p1 TRINITY_DN2684_c1_g1~~TRINITY_DN2684_c1_g1_i1.p1  ORF type:complete len:374 (+),score=96.23 TRINITY_DN2684_c1_g1_i1:49-1122(+)
MDIDYDATVFFLWKKHDGDWDKISKSFSVFLKFAESLGGMEEKQLCHVDPAMLCEPKILQHRLEYIKWKLSQKQESRKEKKKTKKLHSLLEEDSVFGGKSVPSGHNILKNSLSDRLAEIADEVRNSLPTIDDHSDSDTDSEGSLPEVFFSGYDWSKMKLPGDEGFNWESDDIDMTADIPHEKLTGQVAFEENEIKKEPTHRFKTPQELAQQFFASETLPGPSKVNDAINKLESYTNRGLEQQLAAGDMSFLKRMINPDRPKRPSEMKYEDDEDFQMEEEEVVTQKVTDSTTVLEVESKSTVKSGNSISVRNNRWTVIEHSDSSDSETDNNSGGKACKGYKSGKGGKGLKGAKTPLDP